MRHTKTSLFRMFLVHAGLIILAAAANALPSHDFDNSRPGREYPDPVDVSDRGYHSNRFNLTAGDEVREIQEKFRRLKDKTETPPSPRSYDRESSSTNPTIHKFFDANFGRTTAVAAGTAGLFGLVAGLAAGSACLGLGVFLGGALLFGVLFNILK